MANGYELKNVKVLESNSQETYCYTATLYYNGKALAKVSNSGRGGADDHVVLDRETWDRVVERPHDPSGLEAICHGLVADHLIAQDLKRDLRKKAVFLLDGGLSAISYQGGAKPDARMFDMVKQRHPEAVILNTMDLRDALVLVKQVA